MVEGDERALTTAMFDGHQALSFETGERQGFLIPREPTLCRQDRRKRDRAAACKATLPPHEQVDGQRFPRERGERHQEPYRQGRDKVTIPTSSDTREFYRDSHLSDILPGWHLP
jgi:hypothetical protein